MTKLSIVLDFLKFLKQRRKFWLIPLVIIFLGIGLLLVTAQGSVVAPFIYTLF